MYFRVESHVAQKSRRNKLRIQQNSDQNQHLEGCTNTMEHLSANQLPVGGKYESLSYDPNPFSSEMLSYLGRNSQLLLPQNNVLVSDQESGSTQLSRPSNVSFAHSSHQITPKVIADPQNSTDWKSMASQQSCDWDVNYSNGLTGIDQSNPNNLSCSTLNTRPSSFGYHQLLDSINIPATETSGQRLNSQKHYGDLTRLGSSPFCQNLQEVASTVAIQAQEADMASIAQPHTMVRGNNSNELPLLPSYGDQTNTLQLSNEPRWIKRSCGDRHQHNVNSVSNADKSITDTTTNGNVSRSTQGLSLSLSSIPRTNNPEGGFWGGDYQNIPSRHQSLINEVAERPLKADLLSNLDSKGFASIKPVEYNRQNVVGMSGLARSTGPLGPFTGYATILKSSKYLKLTQELLSESCFIVGQEHTEACETFSQNISVDIRITGENAFGAKGSDSGASSTALYCTNKNCSGSSESYRPEFQQKKAKLLYMLDEMCRRYRQHHQQMQMVVSSFESVAGLSSATPYISHALKAVTIHFRSLKNAITVQLRQTRKALGEDLSSPITGTGSSKGDTTGTSMLRCFNHGFQKQNKTGEGFFEPHQPVWRPQRGLPERAVSVLRAWLFDHFLHPYPTDTDKHMLATKTGLTRNQVSNWFINARVRLWKPMVEEIHSLETKTLEERNSNPVQVVSKPPSEGANHKSDDALTTSRLLSTNSTSNTQVEWSVNNSVTLAGMGGDEATAEFWNQEKRSRIDCQIPDRMDGSMLCFEPYQRRGLGGVSLTLGLRRSVEYAQQQLHHTFNFT